MTAWEWGILIFCLGCIAVGLIRGYTDRLEVRAVHERESRPMQPIIPGHVLSDEERAQARLVGLRQGEAAGIKQAARREAKDAARRRFMRELADSLGGELRKDSLRRAGVMPDDGDCGSHNTEL